MHFLETRLRELILREPSDRLVSRRTVSRALKHFPIQPTVSFSFNHPNHTAMEVVAQDQPGLLHNVAQSLQAQKIKLVSAKVATFGERAEDIFFIQNHDRTAVTEQQVIKQLDRDICSALDRTSTKTDKASSKRKNKAAKA